MKGFSYYLNLILVISSFLNLAGCASEKQLTQNNSFEPTEWANTCVDWDDWDKPGPPFPIFGNSYYVGTCGITAILVTGSDGHILIDGGTDGGADVIAENIKQLGFSLKDINCCYLLMSIMIMWGGLAKLQKLSGAKLLASPEARPVLLSGIQAEIDPQAGFTQKPFPAASVDGIVRDGEVVSLGDLSLTAITTPGHTHGALSWQWQSCESSRCLSIVYADSLSPISSDNYHFSDHPVYVADYKKGLRKLAALDCQILITPHPSQSKMRDRLSKTQGLIASGGCMAYADSVSKRLNRRLIKERKNNAAN